MKKKCTGCKKLKPQTDFGVSKEGWTRQPCRACNCLRAKKYRKDPRFIKYQVQYAKKYAIKNKERLKARNLEWKTRIRIEVLTHYCKTKNLECNCCGESELKFLCIDHINGGGKKQGISLNKRGIGFYVWLKKNKYPKGFQTLCHNCNLAKGFYRQCPHKEGRHD